MPVALSTDDEGVSRIDLTHEYQRAVETFGLTYAELKEIVRNSLEYSFLPGASLWGEKREGYGNVVEACRSDALGGDKPCASLRGVHRGKRQGEAAMGARAALPGLRGDPLT